MALVDAVTSGDRREALEAMRAHLAGLLLGAEPREAAALSRELRRVLDELDRLGAGTKGDSVDDLAARRARRRAAAKGVDGAAAD